jgi:hypothetical protein
MLTLFDDLDLGLAPAPFLATTVNVYTDPAFRPLTTQLFDAVVQVRFVGCEVTT